VVAVLALLVTRALGTIAESRRLAQSGYTLEDVDNGLSRVMAERAEHRRELRDSAPVRRRRRRGMLIGAAMFIGSIALVRLTLSMRVQIGPTAYQLGIIGVVLIYVAFAMLGTSVVLLLKSPFRTPPGELFFRLIWLGPVGRGMLWLSARSVRQDVHYVHRPLARGNTSTIGVVSPAPAHAPALAPAPIVSAPVDPLAALEARVRELERQSHRV
ncbi:MAG: hypothetical protein ABI035_03725, partial [Gemmatimonadaceae bacterium]